MKTTKLFIVTFVMNFVFVTFLELISYLLKGPSERSFHQYLYILFIGFLLFPLNALIHDRTVNREYTKLDFNKEKLIKILKKYKAESVKISNSESSYHIPFRYSFNGKVVVKYFDNNIKISAPIRIIRKLEQYEGN